MYTYNKNASFTVFKRRRNTLNKDLSKRQLLNQDAT